MVSLANAAAKRAARFDYSLSFLQAISPPSILGVKTHTLSLGVEILQPYKADIEAISRSSERLVLQLRHKAGGAIAVLVLAMGIATACSNGGDVETNVIETAPATLATPTPPITLAPPTTPSSIAAPLTLAFSGQIAFVSSRDGDSEIYVMNADKTIITRLTTNPARDSDPAWSPDGMKIAFSTNRDGNDEIYVMNADGSEKTRLTENPALDRVASWSPDGSKIAFVSGRDENSEIYVMNADGSEKTRLTNNPAFDSDPTWSPDGTKIAFSTSRATAALRYT